MWHTKLLILHGGVILLAGLLSGVPFGRAIVQGTTDITLARSLYARFIGS